MTQLNLSSVPTEWNQALSTRYMSFWTWFYRTCVVNSWNTPILTNFHFHKAHPWCWASPSSGISINSVSSSETKTFSGNCSNAYYSPDRTWSWCSWYRHHCQHGAIRIHIDEWTLWLTANGTSPSHIVTWLSHATSFDLYSHESTDK